MNKFWYWTYWLAFICSVITLIIFISGNQLSRFTIGVSLVNTSILFWYLAGLEKKKG